MTTAFADRKHPLGRLNPPDPEDSKKYGNAEEAIRGAFGDFAWVDKLLDEVFDFSVAGLLVDAIGVDYGQLKVIADVWNDVRWATADLRENLMAGYADLDPHWQGNAADAFGVYMRNWYDACHEQEAACDKIRDQLYDMSDMLDQFVQTLCSVIGFVIDLLEFPGIAPLKIALNFKEMLDTIKRVKALADTLIDGTQAVTGILIWFRDHDATQTIPQVNVTPPAKPYGGPENPGV